MSNTLMPRNVHEDIARIAQEKFGYTALRPGQQEAIESVLAGRNTLVVQPTGSGKSAIYQIAALLIDGPTVVISPLIALQKDQFDAIEAKDVAPAAIVNSHQRAAAVRKAWQQLDDGSLEFLFLSPEQLHREETMDHLRAHKPSLFVVDEAHCISEWGPSFRPDYVRLGAIIQALGYPTVLALTATAGPEVREQIVDKLWMREPRVFVNGFDRPNIHLRVDRFRSEQDKCEGLLHRVSWAEKPGIVYVATRKHAEDLSAALVEQGVEAAHYHGALPAKERTRIQQEFMAGEASVIVATNAFGMGVDKANVRFVYHYDISDSLDSYYQEIGRAGRDGKPAEAVLFYRPENLNVRKFLGASGKIEEAELARVAEIVHNSPDPVAPAALQAQTELSAHKLATVLNRLEAAEAVVMLPNGELAAVRDDHSTAAHEAAGEQQRHKAHEVLRLERMQAYADIRDCRREYLLSYFGEASTGPCGKCDNCEAKQKRAVQPVTAPIPSPPLTMPPPAPAKSAANPFPLKTRVVHKQWGRGVVRKIDGDKLDILFDGLGHKTLSLTFVQEHHLLELAS